MAAGQPGSSETPLNQTSVYSTAKLVKRFEDIMVLVESLLGSWHSAPRFSAHRSDTPGGEDLNVGGLIKRTS